MATFGFVLELLCQAKGISMEDLSRKTRIPVPTLKAMEENRMGCPDADGVMRIAQAIDCQAADIYRLMQQDVYPNESCYRRKLTIGTTREFVGSEELNALNQYCLALRQLMSIWPGFCQ